MTIPEIGRPIIAHLVDATIKLDSGELLPLFGIGQRIVVERCTDLLQGNPWISTQTFIVKEIDDSTGLCRVIDEETSNYAWISYKDSLTKIKFANYQKKDTSYDEEED